MQLAGCVRLIASSIDIGRLQAELLMHAKTKHCFFSLPVLLAHHAQASDQALDRKFQNFGGLNALDQRFRRAFNLPIHGF